MSSTVFASTRVAPACRARDRATKHRRARPDPRVPREFRSLRAPALEGDRRAPVDGAGARGAPRRSNAPRAIVTRTRRDHVASTLLAVAVSGLVNAVPVPTSWAEDAAARGTGDRETETVLANDDRREREGGSVLGAMEESPMSSTTVAIDAAEAAVPLEIIGGNRPAVARDDALPDEIVVAGTVLTRYVDETSGYSVAVPAGWARDQPAANTPEFHPVSEYGGRRFRVTVTPVGKVASRSLSSLADSDSEAIQDGGFESAASYAAKEASKFAPLEGTPAAKAAGINATTQILDARVSEDGAYYYYSFRSEGVYPFRFWGASAVGPGQTGGARKLGRRDVVSVVAQMPEDKAKEEDYELLRGVVESFRVFDY